MMLSDFFPPTPCDDPLVGECVVCGRFGRGYPAKFSGNFTAYALLQAGDIICERCYTLLHDQRYRRNSWVASEKGVTFLKRDEVLPTLLSPPDPPFAVYITKTGKKQGYLRLATQVNWSRDFYTIAFDDQLIVVDRDDLQYMVDLAREARQQLKFSKSELLGQIKVDHWEHRGLCMNILSLKDDPLWNLVVWAVD